MTWKTDFICQNIRSQKASSVVEQNEGQSLATPASSTGVAVPALAARAWIRLPVNTTGMQQMVAGEPVSLSRIWKSQMKKPLDLA